MYIHCNIVSILHIQPHHSTDRTIMHFITSSRFTVPWLTIYNRSGKRIGIKQIFNRNVHSSITFAMAKRLFEEEDHAKLYARFRPTYSEKVFDKIVIYYEEGKGGDCNYDLAVDVACGNGQSTRPLCKYFRRVIGCDVSPEQILEAKKDKLDNLTFVVSQGENLSFLNNGSVDLITITTALHWLDRPKFHAEVVRVLKPGGVYAVIGYGASMLKKEEGQMIMLEFFNGLLGDYWDERCSEAFSHYEGYTLPFPGWQRIRSPTLDINRRLTIDDYIGFFQTYSAWRKYNQENPNSGEMGKVKESFRKVYGDSGDPVIEVTWPVVMLIGRKPA